MKNAQTARMLKVFTLLIILEFPA